MQWSIYVFIYEASDHIATTAARAQTVCCFLHSYIGFKDGNFLKFITGLLDGMGFVLHHSTTAFIIVSLTTGLFPPSQQILACCVIPVMQHWFVLLR